MRGQINKLVDFVLDFARILLQDIAPFIQRHAVLKSFIPTGMKSNLISKVELHTELIKRHCLGNDSHDHFENKLFQKFTLISYTLQIVYMMT